MTANIMLIVTALDNRICSSFLLVVIHIAVTNSTWHIEATESSFRYRFISKNINRCRYHKPDNVGYHDQCKQPQAPNVQFYSIIIKHIIPLRIQIYRTILTNKAYQTKVAPSTLYTKMPAKVWPSAGIIYTAWKHCEKSAIN